MALRCMLRRIPVRSPSGPLLGPVHGVSLATAAAVPRFLSTQSEGGQGATKAFWNAYLGREKKADRVWKLIDANHDKAMRDIEKIRGNIDLMLEEDRLYFAELEKHRRYLDILGGASITIMFAIAAFVSDKGQCLLASLS